MHDPPCILIVDDHETNRDILAKRLSTQGYDLCQATDGEEALDAAKTLVVKVLPAAMCAKRTSACMRASCRG
jgi:CheY-like chemotaxis protein